MTSDRKHPLSAASAEFDDPAVQRSSSALHGEQAGDHIDRYTLVEEIGEGGMGTVWMAEQREPVRRQVALKIIKLGMDTREVVQRFEAERQALAVMDHPNIARVLDGGATAQGRPYFVMELVRGTPMTEYADQARLGLRERLELFVQVCAAIQHAHQKGIIHRDIKPSNVLVALHGDRAEPKVIDFGIAKATGSEITQRTMFTRFAQVIGTPEYMAPEQASGQSTDIDTRADVYSLGVLLYELLTGSKPFDIRVALEVGFDELLRTIRDLDPEKPSTRVSSVHGLASQVLGRGQVNVQALSKRLRGDLDWIIMKALEKDRRRRYESASGFAEDVSRYLTGDAVLAAPPSSLYRIRKAVRRHRGAVASAALALLLLVGGIAGTSVGLLRAERASGLLRDAVQEKTIALEEETRQRRAAQENLERAVEAEAAAQESAAAAEARRVQAERHADVALGTMQFALVNVARRLGDVPGAAELRASILDDMIQRFEAIEVPLTEGGVEGEAIPTLMAIKAEVARLHAEFGRSSEALEAFEGLLEMGRRRVELKGGNTASRSNLAKLLQMYSGQLQKLTGDSAKSLALKEEAIEVLDQAIAHPSGLPGEPSAEELSLLRSSLQQNCAVEQLRLGRLDDAARNFEGALRAHEATLDLVVSAPGFDDLSDGQRDQRTYSLAMERDRGRLGLAYVLVRLGRTDEGRALYEAALEGRREIAERYPLDANTGMVSLHASRAGFAGNYGGVLLWLQELDAAEPVLAEARRGLEAIVSLQPEDSSHGRALATAHLRLAVLADLRGDPEASAEALAAARAVIEPLQQRDDTLQHRRLSMLVLARAGATARAEALARQQETLEEADGDAHIDRARCYAQLSRHAISDAARRDFLNRSISALTEAADDGFGDRFRVEREPDLIPLAELEEYAALLDRF